LGGGGIIRCTSVSKSGPGPGRIALFPSHAPEGPASAGSIVGKEIAIIRSTLGILLRQLHKTPPSVPTDKKQSPQRTHLRIQQIVRHDGLSASRRLRHRGMPNGLILKQHRVFASKKLRDVLRASERGGEVELS